ncbi:ABC transporter substrate-binding protein [Halococcus saccharolyticus]|uniref:Extracellular solute-binding protein family 5 n=1 Tax=Halococcus saccharolyticus DSM 5350 TaxID=1227455 RepID=M0MBX8_9EURY|nr:ABC transporter substrate-binding protein [Halococcus saccharolyticus]EMA43251.1 extracellular solute-binding protein family 5 [Halococcus saccharolyticus DSM 5350]
MSSDDERNRRSFLKAAGGAAAATAIAGCLGGGDGGNGSGGNGSGGDTGGGGNASGGGANDSAGGNATGGGNETGGDGNQSAGGGGSGGTLVYARGSHSSTLDFQNSTSGEVAKVTEQMYDSLIGFVPGEATLTEELATDYSLEEQEATLTLREGVTFHNGEEFTAEDFVATFRRFTDTEYQYYAGDDYVSAYGPFTFGDWIDEISTDGDYSMTISLTQKYAPFLRNLAIFAAAIHSKAAIEDDSIDLSQQAVGTGAFQLENLNDGQGVVRLSAYDDYWGEGPQVSAVVFETIGQNSTRAQSLTSGEVDIADGLGAQASQQVQSAQNAELRSVEGINTGYMAFNMNREVFQSKQVRQAISYAIDTQAIVENIYAGFASQAAQPIPPNVLGHNEELEPYSRDLEQAQSLLEEAGYGDGFSFELATFQNPRGYNPSPLPTAQTVKSNLSEIGIEVTINQQSFDPFLTYTAEGRHDACFLGWYTDNADPDNFAYVLLHPQVEDSKLTEGQDWVSFDTEGYNTSNRSGWANREYMDLVEQGQSTYDEAARTEAYTQAMQIAHDEAPWVYLDHAKELRGVGNRVSNYTVAAIGGPYLNLVTLGQ